MKPTIIKYKRMWRAGPLPDRGLFVSHDMTLGDDGGRTIAVFRYPVVNWFWNEQHKPGAYRNRQGLVDGVYCRIVSYQGREYLCEADFCAPTRARWQHRTNHRTANWDEAWRWLTAESRRMMRLLYRVQTAFATDARDDKLGGERPEYVDRILETLPPTAINDIAAQPALL